MEILKLSNTRLKYLQSLKLKKYREKYSSFIIEGRKAVMEALKAKDVKMHALYALTSWLTENEGMLQNHEIKIHAITPAQLKKISSFKTPDRVALECGMLPIELPFLEDGLVLFLDGVQDPGNAGTIIRTADWFGVSLVVLGTNSVDLYNPKTLQATMGSIFRMPCSKNSFSEICAAFPGWTIYASDLQGEAIEDILISPKSILIVGQESSGVSIQIKSQADHLVKINKSGESQIDSLNVGVATGILLHKYLT